MRIPSLVLKQLYTFGSLENIPEGSKLSLKNRLSDAILTELVAVRVDGKMIPGAELELRLGSGEVVRPEEISPDKPVSFPLSRSIDLVWLDKTLEIGKHSLEIEFVTSPFGDLKIKIKDAIREFKDDRVRIPLDKEDDYSEEIVEKRREFVRSFTGIKPVHLFSNSFDPQLTAGNIEHFTGVAQIPIGFVGPMSVNGEYAKGDFIVPMATTEGTLVASYNRGIKVLNLSGGVTCTVSDDRMQRAPVFVFDSAREAREFKKWVEDNIALIRKAAEATSSVAKLLDIDIFLSNKFCFLRFNYSTGDAAGQNMVGRATFAACSWMLEQLENVRSFYLESNLATDKKHSQINLMRTRGKRVTAEATIPRDVLVQHMRVEPETLNYHAGIANVGAMLSGANNNGAHSPNGITAIFMATGQDVANVSESSSGIVYTEVTAEGDLYISITIPSLIVATFGGGTALPTQSECLDILGCRGRDKVKKLAEIIGGVVLAGEISLASAISSLDWVSSHEKYGRNR